MDRETHFDLEAIEDLRKIQKILSDNGYIASTTILRATEALWDRIKRREGSSLRAIIHPVKINEDHSK